MLTRCAFALPFALALAACGGASSPPAPGGSAVGGSGELPGQGAAPIVPPPDAPAAATEPGPWFGVRNATGSDLVAYAWWETRANVPAPFPGGHWYNLVPLGEGVRPGEVRLLSVHEDGRPLYEPAFGPLDVVAYLRDGRVIAARILYAPTSSAVWIVR